MAQTAERMILREANLIYYYRWIAGRISEILGNDDDVVIELCFNLLEGARYVNQLSILSTVPGILTRVTARYQEITDSAYRFSRQRYPWFL